jgi:hypothetical protein
MLQRFLRKVSFPDKPFRIKIRMKEKKDCKTYLTSGDSALLLLPQVQNADIHQEDSREISPHVTFSGSRIVIHIPNCNDCSMRLIAIINQSTLSTYIDRLQK